MPDMSVNLSARQLNQVTSPETINSRLDERKTSTELKKKHQNRKHRDVSKVLIGLDIDIDIEKEIKNEEIIITWY